MTKPQQNIDVDQSIKNNQGNFQTGNAGQDGTFYQDNSTYDDNSFHLNLNVGAESLTEELSELDSFARIINYVLALFFLIGVTFSWLLIGLFAGSIPGWN